MKHVKIISLFCFLSVTSSCEKTWDTSLYPEIPTKPDVTLNTGKYEFSNGVMSAEVLNNYLSRAITQTEFLSNENTTTDGIYGSADDERMLLNIGAKLIGRSMYSWGREDFFQNTEWFAKAKEKIDRMHASDPDLIFQAALFEIVTKRVNDIAIPAWVFEAFDKTAEQRNFNFDNIRNANGLHANQWGDNTCVPDMQREETQMFFYYMAVKYMEIGIEAFHCGQVELMASMGDAKNGYMGWRTLLSKLRKVAKTKAARGGVIFDGHMPSGGIVYNDNQLLFDFVSFPLRLKEIVGEPMKAKLQKGYLDAIYGYTKGGITPSGWECKRINYLVEFDNFGVSEHPGTYNWSDVFCWGYDEISWLYKVDETYACEFMAYAVNFLRTTDPVGYVQMPGARLVVGAGSGVFYHCNTNSEACPNGKSSEETIKLLWSEQ